MVTNSRLLTLFGGGISQPPNVGALTGEYFTGLPVVGTRVPDGRSGLGDVRACRPPQAGLFDGSISIVTVADNAAIQNVFANGGACSAWVYPRSDGEGSVGRIINKRGAGGWYFRVQNESAGYVRLTFIITFSGNDGTWSTVALDLPLFQWSLVDLSYDASSVSNDPTICVNGESKALTESGTPTGVVDSDSGETLVFGNNTATSATLDGLLSDVRLFNAPLTDVARARLLAHEPVGSEVGWWPLCEESGSVIHDLVGGNHGAAANMDWVPLTDWCPSGPWYWNPNDIFGYAKDGDVYIPAQLENGVPTGLAATGDPLTVDGIAPNDLIASSGAMDGKKRWDDPAVTLTPQLSAANCRNPWSYLTRWGEGADLVTNGGFDADTDWNKGTGWSIAAGVAHCDGSQVTSSNFYQDIGIVIGRRYRVIFTISNYVAGQVRPLAGSQGIGTYRSANGTYTEDMVAKGTAPNFYFFADVDFEGDIDNVIVYPLQTIANTLVLPSQLLADGDMEAAGTAAWTAGGSAALTKETTTPRSGSRCLRVTYNGTNLPYAYQAICTVGNVYRITGWARGDGTWAPRFNSGANLSLTGTTSTNWQYFEATWLADGTNVLCRAMATGAGYCEFDDVRIELVMSDTERAIRENYFNRHFADLSEWDDTAAAQSGEVSKLLMYDEPQTGSTLSRIEAYTNGAAANRWLMDALATTATSGFDPALTLAATCKLLPLWFFNGQWLSGIAPTFPTLPVGTNEVVFGPPAIYPYVTSLVANADEISAADTSLLTACVTINLKDNGMTWQEVDAVIAIWLANADDLEPATVDISGTNAAPSATGIANIAILTDTYGWAITRTT